jgi:hypothetical protein
MNLRFAITNNPGKTYDWNYSDKLRTGLISRFRSTGDKTKLPLLKLESAGITTSMRHLICVDIDNLKAGTAQGICESLRCQWAAVAVSPRGNGLKIFLRIQGSLPTSQADFATLKQEVTEQFLDRLAQQNPLWGQLLPGWDDAVVSLTRVFATEEIGEAALLGAASDVAVVRWGVGSEVGSRYIVSNLIPDSSKHRFQPISQDTPLPDTLREFIGIGGEALLRAQFLRLILALRKLTDSFDLPQKKIASELDVSISQVNKWMKELQLRGWLQVLDHSYTPGIKAKSYKATSHLLYAIQQLSKSTKKSSKGLPTQVEAGRWYLQVLSALWYFSSEAVFLQWIDTLEGVTHARRNEAKRYATCHFRKLRSGGHALRAQ